MIAISYFDHWTDTEKDEEKQGGDMLKAEDELNGGQNEELVKIKPMEEPKGMHFQCPLRCEQISPFRIDCVFSILPYSFSILYPLTLYAMPCSVRG